MLYFKAPGGELVPYTSVLTFTAATDVFETGMDSVCIACGQSVVAHFTALSCYGQSARRAEAFIQLLENAAYAFIKDGRDCGVIDVKEVVGGGFDGLFSGRERFIASVK